MDIIVLGFILENVKVLIDQLNAESADLTELERIFQFSSPQFVKLIDIIVKVEVVIFFLGGGRVVALTP